MFQFPEYLIKTINNDLEYTRKECPKCTAVCVGLFELKETPQRKKPFSYRAFSQCLVCDYEEEL